MRLLQKLVPNRMPLIALNLAVLLVIAGGTAAFGVFTKTVTLTVDGHTQTVRTFGSSVGEVLASKGVKLAVADRVTPTVNASIADGTDIDVAYARPLTLSVDGVKGAHIVYTATVEKALDTFGIRPHINAYLSAKPATKIPRTGLNLVVSNPKKLKIVSDGDTKHVTTAAPTVGAVLTAAGVTLDADDEVKPAKDVLVTPNAKVEVVRVRTETRTEDVRVKFPVEVTKDDSMEKGQKKILTPGKTGLTRETVAVTTADGKIRQRDLLSATTVSMPVKQVEVHGTQTAPSVASDSVWDKIAECESGGNWHINTGNGYYGGLQFSAATWRSVGGTGLPSDHSREEQIKRAKILQARSGWGQWGCAHARFN